METTETPTSDTLTTAEKRKRIDALYDLAARQHRSISTLELEEIERLSAEIYEDARLEEATRWLKETMPGGSDSRDQKSEV